MVMLGQMLFGLNGSIISCKARYFVEAQSQQAIVIVYRANAFASRKLQAGKGQSGSCLHARSAAACPPCSTAQGAAHNSCPDGAVCMSPVVSPGDHMYRVCFHPSSATGDARWLPGQAGTTGRKVLSLQQPAGLDVSQPTGLGAQQHKGQRQVTGAHANVAAANATLAHGGVALTDATQTHQEAQEGTMHRQFLSKAAHLAAHPVKDDAKLTSATLQSQSLQQNSSNSLLRPYAQPGAVRDRIGRVALANEHRKVIRQESSPSEGLSCAHYLVYVGTSGQLMQALDVSDFVPRSTFVPLQWPHVIEQMLVYTFAVSAALALINMAPIWYLDGEAALLSAVKLRGQSDIFYSSVSQPSRHWGRLLRCVLGVGSCIFVCVLVLHMVRLLGYDAKLGHHLHTLGKLLSFVMT